MDQGLDNAFQEILAAVSGPPHGSSPYQVWETAYLRLHRNRYLAVVRDVKELVKGGRILDVGSVPCHLTALLAASGYDTVGVDGDPERAGAMIQRFDLDIRAGDLEAGPLDFPDGHFPTILLAEVFEHLYVNPLGALRELVRILQPGGTLLLYTDNLYSLGTIRRFVLGRSINDALEQWSKLDEIGHRGHIRLYSRREMTRILEAVGLEVVEHRYHHYNPTASRLSALAYSLAPRWLRPSQLLVARRKEGAT